MILNRETYPSTMTKLQCKPSLFSPLLSVIVLKRFFFSLLERMQTELLQKIKSRK